MTRIKICGITNAEDARAACENGADALGFIFVPGSSRYVGHDLPAIRKVMQGVPPLVWRVGVFDTPPSAPGFDLPELHAIQYYNKGEAFHHRPRGPVPIKAFRIRDEESLRDVASDTSPKQMILLDTYSPNTMGGTGHTFNWELALQAKEMGLPVILAGGLTPENVAEAVIKVRPYAVDVSSGVECEPGRKDHDKLRRFIRAVREADLR